MSQKIEEKLLPPPKRVTVNLEASSVAHKHTKSAKRSAFLPQARSQPLTPFDERVRQVKSYSQTTNRERSGKKAFIPEDSPRSVSTEPLNTSLSRQGRPSSLSSPAGVQGLTNSTDKINPHQTRLLGRDRTEIDIDLNAITMMNPNTTSGQNRSTSKRSEMSCNEQEDDLESDSSDGFEVLDTPPSQALLSATGRELDSLIDLNSSRKQQSMQNIWKKQFDISTDMQTDLHSNISDVALPADDSLSDLQCHSLASSKIQRTFSQLNIANPAPGNTIPLRVSSSSTQPSTILQYPLLINTSASAYAACEAELPSSDNADVPTVDVENEGDEGWNGHRLFAEDSEDDAPEEAMNDSENDGDVDDGLTDSQIGGGSELTARERALRHLESYFTNMLSQVLVATQILDARENETLNPQKKKNDTITSKRKTYHEEENQIHDDQADKGDKHADEEKEDEEDEDDDEDGIDETEYEPIYPGIETQMKDERAGKRLKERQDDAKIGINMTMKNRKNGCDRWITFPDTPLKSLKKASSMYQISCIMRVASLLYEAILTNCITTKRDIYYKDVAFFKSQAIVDKLVDDIVASANLRRQDFNVRATSKGLIHSSALLIKMKNGEMLPVSSFNGCLIPPTEDIESVDVHEDDTELQWVLIVEKDAVFQTLCSLGLIEQPHLGSGAIITGKGYPDLSTIQLISRIANRFPLAKIYCLVDADPHGLSILSVYTNGSRATSHSREYEGLALGDRLVWLGVKGSELIRHGVAYDHLLPLSKRDVEMAMSMIRDTSLPLEWRKELGWMLHVNRKAEIQVLSSIRDEGDGQSYSAAGGRGLLKYVVDRLIA